LKKSEKSDARSLREYETTEDFLDHYRSLEKAHAPRMLRAVSAKKKAGTAEQAADQVR